MDDSEAVPCDGDAGDATVADGGSRLAEYGARATGDDGGDALSDASSDGSDDDGRGSGGRGGGDGGGAFVHSSAVRGAGIDDRGDDGDGSSTVLLTFLAEARARAAREVHARLAAEARTRDTAAEVDALRVELQRLEAEAGAARRSAGESADVAVQWRERCDAYEAECERLRRAAGGSGGGGDDDATGTAGRGARVRPPSPPGSPPRGATRVGGRDVGAGDAAVVAARGRETLRRFRAAVASAGAALAAAWPALGVDAAALAAAAAAAAAGDGEGGASGDAAATPRSPSLSGAGSGPPSPSVASVASAASPRPPPPPPPPPAPADALLLAFLGRLPADVTAASAALRARADDAGAAALRAVADLELTRAAAEAAARGAADAARAAAEAHAAADAAAAAEAARLTAIVDERSELVRKWEAYSSHWEGRGREAERLNVEWEAAFDRQAAMLAELQAAARAELGLSGGGGGDGAGGGGGSAGGSRGGTPPPHAHHRTSVGSGHGGDGGGVNLSPAGRVAAAAATAAEHAADAGTDIIGRPPPTAATT